MMQIVRATMDDLEELLGFREAVHALHSESEPHVYRGFNREEMADEIISALEAPAMEFWLALWQDEPVGCIQLQFFDRPQTAFTHARQSLEVHQLSVEPGAQGRGIGRALMEHAEARAVSLGASRVTLGVRTVNEKAVSFYTALGYDTVHLRMSRPIGAEENH